MIEGDWFHETVGDRVGQIVKVGKTILSEKTPFQQIDVYETDQFGRILVLDGALNVAQEEEFIYHEMLAHVPMFIHPGVERLLVIGGGDGGVVREALKHPGCRIDLVDIDRRVVEISRQYFPAVSSGLDDPRVRVHFEDGTGFVRRFEATYDVIVVDSTDPVGAGTALYQESFYRDIYRALRPNGVVTAQTESPFFDRDIIRDLYPKLRRVFPLVRTYMAPVPFYPGTLWSFAFCSKGLDPIDDFDPKQGLLEQIETRYYDAEVHTSAFVLPGSIREVFEDR
jgi:spermidine synthase